MYNVLIINKLTFQFLIKANKAEIILKEAACIQPNKKQSFSTIVKLLTPLVLLHIVIHIYLLVIVLRSLILILPHEVLSNYIILTLLHI